MSGVNESVVLSQPDMLTIAVYIRADGLIAQFNSSFKLVLVFSKGLKGEKGRSSVLSFRDGYI